MEVSRIITEIDAQISKLQQARQLLAGAALVSVSKGPGRPKGNKGPGRPKSSKGSGRTKSTRGPGRPKGSKNASASVVAVAAAPRKRKLSAEGRKRIAEAMKKRWAERKKQSNA
jgi:hypothetical protein